MTADNTLYAISWTAPEMLKVGSPKFGRSAKSVPEVYCDTGTTDSHTDSHTLAFIQPQAITGQLQLFRHRTAAGWQASPERRRSRPVAITDLLSCATASVSEPAAFAAPV